MGSKLKNPDFLALFMEKNSDGSRHLRLTGRELYQRIKTRVTAELMPAIIDFLTMHPEIISLDFSYNDFGDDGLKLLAENYFNQDNDLLHINLMHCDITMNGVDIFSQSECLNLVSIRLNGNVIGAAGARYIAKLIENSPNLQIIDIAETNQTVESLESILIVIEQNYVKVLDISRIIPQHYFIKYDVSVLAEDLSILFKVSQTLVEIHAQKCSMDGHDIGILLDGLALNKCLQMLDIGCNNIGDYGATLIAKWLKTRPPLTGLNISANGIKDFGAIALSCGLPFSRVRYLELSNNKITDWGLSDLLDSLKKSNMLRMLFIWGNEIGPEACHKIQRMLLSQVLDQDYIDVKIYEVDKQLFAAYYPSNHYKHKFYCVQDYGYPPDIKIKRNKIYPDNAQPRELMNFSHVGRYPPVDEDLGLKITKEKDCQPNTRGLIEVTRGEYGESSFGDYY